MQGLSINSFDLNGTTYPLVWGGAAVNYTVGSNTFISSLCAEGTMNSEIVQGKMVFCETIDDGSGILLANGVGAIMADSYYSDLAFNYPLPATVISTEDGIKVLDYIRTTEYIYSILTKRISLQNWFYYILTKINQMFQVTNCYNSGIGCSRRCHGSYCCFFLF